MRSSTLVFLLLLAACTPPTPVGPDLSVRPSWAQDVAPLVSQHCSACHVEGGVAPFALTTYAQAQSMAGAMAAATAAKRMPPWMPGGATPALEHARALSAEQIAVFQTWFELNAPEGDTASPAALPPPEQVRFEAPDLSVDIGVDYVPDARVSDDYRCFLVDLALPGDRMAAALRVTPGNRKTVHHVIATLFDASDRAALESIDAASAGPGWQCFGGPVPNASGVQPAGALGSWVPGVTAVRYPAGTGVKVAGGSLVVMQVHYNLAGGVDPDRTRLELEFAAPATESTLQPISAVPLARLNLAIPPGSTGWVEEQTLPARTWARNRFYPDGDGWVIGVAGHMHTRGQRFQILRTSGGVESTLLDIPAWDFHWQGSYVFKTPVQLLPTDNLTVRCTFENPGATTITWGEGTADEMCLANLQVVDQRP